MSQRFGEGNKLLTRVHGKALVRRVASAFIEAGLDPVLVVVGYEMELVSAELAESPVTIVHNPGFARGLSRALVRGVRAIPEGACAAVIGVADQPFLTAGVLLSLTGAYRSRGAPIVAPLFGSRRGNPVVFDRALFSELLRVEGDQGGRSVIERHLDEVEWVEVGDERAGLDVDTLGDLEQL
jgi:molybdenum cofactor cytidylyltransferase